MHTIYRDLKPENIMMLVSGYLKLVDMGSSKMLAAKGLAKTYTIVGTPHYMAPEVLASKGYSYAADLWSLGVCIFEFCTGSLPFGVLADDPF